MKIVSFIFLIFLTITFQDSADPTSELAGIITTYLKNKDAIMRRITGNGSYVVKKIVQEGFDSFSQYAMYSEFNGLRDEVINQFISMISQKIDMPQESKDEFQKALTETISKSNNSWVVFNFMFSLANNTGCKYVCIFARHDQLLKKSYWLVNDIKMTFDLAKDIYIVHTTKLIGNTTIEEDVIVEKPKEVSDLDVENLLEYFKIISFTKIADSKNIPVPKTLALIKNEISKVESKADLINSLKGEASKIAAGMPGSTVNVIINNVGSNGDFQYDSCNAGDFQRVLNEKHGNLPAEVKNWINMIVLSQSINFQTFHFQVGNGQASLVEYIVAARNNNNAIEFAYLFSSSNGGLIQQYNDVVTRSCHRVLFWKKCHDVHNKVARGFTSDELNRILLVLRATAYNKIMEKLNAPSLLMSSYHLYTNSLIEINKLPTLPLTNMDSASSNDKGDTYLDAMIEKMLQIVIDLKKSIETTTKSEIIKTIVNRGFTSFEESATIQEIKGVSDSNLELFASIIRQNIELPPEYEKTLKDEIEMIQWEDENNWIIVTLVFSINSGGDCKYITILGRHDFEAKNSHWLVADIKAHFALAPAIYVVREKKSYLGGLWSSEKDVIVLKPQSLTMDQVTLLFQFFEVIAIERFAEFRNLRN